jgi:hypothetical protein
VKGCLLDYSFADADQLRQAILALLNAIKKATLQAAFLEWMKRLRKFIYWDGEDIE